MSLIKPQRAGVTRFHLSVGVTSSIETSGYKLFFFQRIANKLSEVKQQISTQDPISGQPHSNCLSVGGESGKNNCQQRHTERHAPCTNMTCIIASLHNAILRLLLIIFCFGSVMSLLVWSFWSHGMMFTRQPPYVLESQHAEGQSQGQWFLPAGWTSGLL